MKNKILFMSGLFSIAMSLFFAAFVANATGLPAAPIAAVLIALSAIPVKNADGALMDAINLTDLVAKLGAYYRKFRPTLTSEILLDLGIEDRFTVMDDVKDQIALPNLSITDLVKPANPITFQPTSNAIAFGARIGQVRPWKVDLQLIPQLYEKTWLGGYMKKGSNIYDVPFEAYIFQKIIQKIHENIRLQSLYKGVYNPTGITPLDVMDGLLTKLSNEITALNITPVVTGVITQANVVDKLLSVYDTMGEAYKAVPTIMPINPTMFDWYTRKFAPVLNPSLVATDVAAGLTRGLLNEFPLSGSNATLLREPGMSSSQRVFCTTKENINYMTDTFGEENNIQIQHFERTIKIMIDAKSGVEFNEVNSRALAVNDQA